MITASEFSRIARYEPETGDFVWLESLTRRKAGTKAARRPYVQLSIGGKLYYAHRLAWLVVYGEFPKGQLDHINGDPSDNRIANLREATPRQNSANTRAHRDNKSGYKGIFKLKSGKYMAAIKEDGRLNYLGVFDDPVVAYQRYSAEAIRIHGEFARLD